MAVWIRGIGPIRVLGLLVVAVMTMGALGACGPRGQQNSAPDATAVPAPTATLVPMVPTFPPMTPTGTVPPVFFPIPTVGPFATPTPTVEALTPTPTPTMTPTPLSPTATPTPIPFPTATPIPIPTPTPGFGTSAQIVSYLPQMVTDVVVEERVMLSMTFVNTGAAAGSFTPGVSVWDASGREVVSAEAPQMVLWPGEARTVEWTYIATAVGSQRVQFGVWREKPGRTLLHKWPDPSQFLINVRARSQQGGG